MPLSTTSSVGAALKRGMPVAARSSGARADEDSDASSRRRSRSRASLKRVAGGKAAGSSPSRSRSISRGRHQRQGRSQVRGLRRVASGPSGFGRREDRSPRRCSRTPAGRSAPPPSRRGVKECWFGRYCSRSDCWFAHPEGRKIDEMKARQRRHSKEQKLRKQRASSSSSSSPRRSRSAPRPKRSASRPKRSPARSASSTSRKTSRSASARSATPRSASRSSAGKGSGNAVTAEVEGQTSTTPSFKEFVLQKLDDDATPDTAIAMFEEYKKDLFQMQMESIKGTGLFRDLYCPLSALRRFDLRSRSAQRAAEDFLKDLNEGRFEDLCLRAATSGSPTCPTTGHMKSPHFAFDPDINALLVEGIPPAMSVWALHDVAAQAPGLAGVAWSRPASAEAARELRLRLASEEQAQAALAALAEVSTEEGQKLQPKLLEPSTSLSALVVPPEMSHPDRLEKDAELSAQVIRVLDALVGVPPEPTEAMLGRKAPVAAVLDLQVLYLRRVHHFCFYAASWCNDEWDLLTRCGAALVRDSGSDKPAEEGDWAKAHEDRLRSFLVNAEFQRPEALDTCKDQIAAKTEALCQEKTKQVVEGKFRCLECSKYFKGPDYVHKHLRKVHAELFQAVQQEVRSEAAAAAFLANPLPIGTGSK